MSVWKYKFLLIYIHIFFFFWSFLKYRNYDIYKPLKVLVIEGNVSFIHACIIQGPNVSSFVVYCQFKRTHFLFFDKIGG